MPSSSRFHNSLLKVEAVRKANPSGGNQLDWYIAGLPSGGEGGLIFCLDGPVREKACSPSGNQFVWTGYNSLPPWSPSLAGASFISRTHDSFCSRSRLRFPAASTFPARKSVSYPFTPAGWIKVLTPVLTGLTVLSLGLPLTVGEDGDWELAAEVPKDGNRDGILIRIDSQWMDRINKATRILIMPMEREIASTKIHVYRWFFRQDTHQLMKPDPGSGFQACTISKCSQSACMETGLLTRQVVGCCRSNWNSFCRLKVNSNGLSADWLPLNITHKCKAVVQRQFRVSHHATTGCSFFPVPTTSINPVSISGSFPPSNQSVWWVGFWKHWEGWGCRVLY